MSSSLILTGILFFGYLAYVIGAQIHTIKEAVKSEETLDAYRKENEGFAVVRTTVLCARQKTCFQ